MGYAASCFDDQSYMMRELDISNDQADRIADIDADYRSLYYENRRDYSRTD